MRQIALPSGATIPAFGLGTWRMGEDRRRRAEEVAALRLGLDLGVRLIDTAEMYGEGGAEEIVAEAASGRRDELFVVSKVYPHTASRPGVVAACERSLKRLRTDRIDLYLLHWRGSHPLAGTVAGFEELVAAGKIRHWGVSNFDTDDMEELAEVAGGERVQTDQVLYNLARRGVEWDLVPWCRTRRMPIMAYSPLDQGGLPKQRALKEIALRRDVTPAQVALAWLLSREDVVVIPKAGRPDHLRDDLRALELKLSSEDMAALDRAFPPPRSERPLEMY